MGSFDAANHILTTISSGGFSTRSASIGAFASGIDFAFCWRMLKGGSISPQAAEVRAFLLILAASIAASPRA